MSMKRSPVLLVLTMLLSVSLAAAQPQKPWKSWFGQIAVGYSAPMDTTGDLFDGGWNVSGGFTWRPDTWPIGLWGELGYNQFDVKGSVARDLQDLDIATGGEMDIWSLTGGSMWSTRSQGVVNFYVAAGLGWYRRETKLTEPGVGVVPPGCSPWWYWCTPGGLVPVTLVTGSQTDSEVGANLGLGLTFSLGSDSQVYLEAKYHAMDSDPQATEWIPIVVGYRW